MKSLVRGLHVIRSGGAAPTLGPLGMPDCRAADPPDDGRLGTLHVDFSRFNSWYEIDSWWEGRFLERTRRGSFQRTIVNNRDQVKVLFNHGFEFNEGDKLLGPIEVLEERPASPHMEVKLLDAPFAQNLAPGLREGIYGSSFMFEVLQDEWNHEPGRSDHNPDGIPERTITEVRLFEAGPVTWPANPEATAGLRSASGTDWLLDQLGRHDPGKRSDLIRSLEAFRVAYGLRTPPPSGPATSPQPDLKTPAPGATPARHVESISHATRAARLRALQLDRLRRFGSGAEDD